MRTYACPPEWDVTPMQYSKWRADSDAYNGRHATRPSGRGGPRPGAGTGTGVPTVLFAGLNSTAWAGFAALATNDPHPSINLLMAAVGMGSAAILAKMTSYALRSRSVARLAHLPANHADLVLPLSRTKAESLSFDINAGHHKGGRAAGLAAAWSTAEVEAIAAKKAELEAKRKKEAEDAARAIAAQAADKDKTIEELQKALTQKILIDNPAPQAPAPATTADLLRLANERHDRVRDAWTEIITDPLNALEHASLFDVADTRTAAFISAYGALEDLRAIYPSGIPTALAESYAEQTRECERLWDDAYAYSTKRGYDFLPDGERDLARKAARMLALAADEAAPVHERAQAATKAAEMLTRISAITLPEPSRAQIASLSRLALTAGPVPA